MSKVLFSYFKSYSGRLAKLQYDQVPTESDLMGATTEDGSQTKSGFGNLTGNFNSFFSSAARGAASKGSTATGLCFWTFKLRLLPVLNPESYLCTSGVFSNFFQQTG